MRVQKKKKERRKRNKRRNTKPQTKKTRPRTTGKQGMTTKYVTAPCVLHIVSTATHTWMRKPSMLRRRAPKGQHRTQKRTTNRHARQKACPQTQTTTIYPPYLFLHRLRPCEIHDEKKKNQQKRKRYGAATDKGETMKRRTSEAHQPRGNNGMASKYVNNATEGAKGTDHAHTHTHKQDRKVREDGDKNKEKQCMKPHTAPPAYTHTLSL